MSSVLRLSKFPISGGSASRGFQERFRNSRLTKFPISDGSVLISQSMHSKLISWVSSNIFRGNSP